MKKFSKILCAVLVIAVLCSSLIFMVGAEESAATSNLLDGYTSVSMTKDDGAKLLEAVKYSADDNLLTSAGISYSKDTDTIEWGNEGGRGSDLITHTASGNVFYKEYLVGSTEGKYGDLTYQAAGNDYINYGFTKVDLTKEDGYNKYIVVDFDFAYEGTPDGLAFQVITRGNGAYWATVQQFKNLGVPADTVAHVTAVYDYASGNSLMFVNGKHVTTVDNGALTDAGSTDYEAGVTMGAYEFRVGSNSSMNLYFDNLYIRSVKNETSSDDLGAAVAATSLAGWSGNIYSASYSSFALPYFVKTLNANGYTDNAITSGGSTPFLSESTGNNVTYIATGNNTNSPYITIGTAGSTDPYLVAYCNTTTSYKGGTNNLFLNANVPNTDPFTVVGDEAKGYYVIDLDVATHGNMLPDFDVSVVMRRESDTSGYPFSDELYIGGYVTDTDAWSHVTIIGDIANNVAKIYVNGQYVGDGGKAVRTGTEANYLANDTRVVAQGFRVELTRNNVQTDVTAGDNVAFDNFSHRLYVTDNYDAITSAIADGNITDWADYAAGRTGEKLPVIATVNGVEYKNMAALEAALASNESLTVEFLGQPLVPVALKANAVVNTHGMDIDTLVSFSGDAPTVDGNYYTFVAPYTANREDTPLTFASGNVDDVTNAVKGTAANNVFTRYNTVTAGAWNTHGYRNATIVTNPFTGETIYRESASVDEGKTTTTGQNEYTNFFFSHPGLSYEEGKNDYIVIDFDFTYEGVLDQYQSFSVIPRNNGGGRWSAGTYINKLPVNEAEMAHITMVFDYTNNKNQVFVNGELLMTVDSGAINAAGHTEYLGGTALTISEFKLGSNSLNTVYLDNLNIRVYDVATADDTLDDAIAAKDITKWADNIYTDSYVVPQLPALATVDGVEYVTASALEAALIGNDKVEVELLHSTTETIVVACPAVINTNGLAHGFVECEGGTVTEDGKILTFTAPYATNDHIVGEGLNTGSGTTATLTPGNALFDAVYYNAEDNLFAKIHYNNYQAENFRAAYLMTDPESGNKYIYDTVYSGDPAGKNTFMNWHYSGAVATKGQGYSLGVNQYLVMDFDVAFDAYANTNLNFTTRDDAGTNIAGVGFNVNEAMIKAGVPAGHFAHITVLGEVDTNTVYVYVNGVKQLTVSNGLSRLDMAAGYYLDGIRGFQNLDVSIKYDNMYMRVVEDATLVGLNTLAGSSIELYNDSYELPTLPKFATVDGVDCYSAAEVSALLYGNVETPKQVEFFHVAEGTVIVTCDAVLNTHGMDIALEYYHTGKLSDLGDGVYSFDCGYVSATKVENVTVTSSFGSAVLVSGNGNALSGITFDKTSTWMNTSWYDEAGNTVYGMHTYLISTEGMDNVYGMIARPEGSSGVIGKEYYTKNTDGELVYSGDGVVTGTYINLNHASPAFTYSASENNYWVYDFDILIEGEELNMHPYALIKTASGGFQYGSFDLPLSEYVVDNGNKGAFNHVTIVADYNNNLEYIYVNDVFVATSPLMAEVAPATAYVEGNSYNHNGLRISLGSGEYSDNASLAIDNILARKFVTSNSDNLAAAMEANDITLWTGRYAYTLPETPVLGTVNGTEYNTVGELEAAIAANESSTVELVRPIRGAIAVDGVATVETNGFAEVVGAKVDGYYEFVNDLGDTVKASGKYIVTSEGNVYNVELISAENYGEHSTYVEFYPTPGSYDDYECYAFLYGDVITPPVVDGGASAGQLAIVSWYLDGDEAQTPITEFPVASAELGTLNYCCKIEIQNIPVNTQVSLVVNTDFTVVLYVEVTEENGVQVGNGETTVIDGVTYLVLTSKLAAHKLGDEVVFEYVIAYQNEAGEYQTVKQTETVKVSVYAEELFAGEYTDLDKNVMYAALAYSNEAYKLLAGAENAEFAALLETYATYAPANVELGEKADVSAISDVIRSAALKLDYAPAFAFKVAMGFKGTISFTYTSLGETVVVSKDVDATAGETLVYLDGFKAYDIHSDIAIEIVDAEGNVLSANFNLGTYAQMAADNSFAVALLNYATVAESHKTAAN